MKISDYLDVRRICVELTSTSKNDSIKELSGVLKGSKDIVGFDKFVSDVFARENLKTTGIGDEVAVPHARTDAVKKIVVAFGVSKTGIDFQSIDKKLCKLIFLIGIPTDNISSYLQILAHLTRLLKREDFRQELLQAEDSKQVIKIFKEIEK